jgi:hypothetical protein
VDRALWLALAYKAVLLPITFTISAPFASMLAGMPQVASRLEARARDAICASETSALPQGTWSCIIVEAQACHEAQELHARSKQAW